MHIRASEPMRVSALQGIRLTAALLAGMVLLVGPPAASADAIIDMSNFLTQAQSQMQSPFGYYSWTYALARTQLSGVTTLDNFAGSLTPDSAHLEIALSKSLEIWCNPEAPTACIQNGPTATYSLADEAFAMANGAGAGRAQIASLGATATMSGEADRGSVNGEASGEARFWDTIAVPASTNYSGYLQVEATVWGQLAVAQVNGQPYAAVGLTYGGRFGQLGAFAANIWVDAQGNPHTSLSPSDTDLRNGIPVDIRVPFEPSGYNPATGLYSYTPVWFYMDLSASVVCATSASGGDTAGCSAASNYQDTLQITKITVLDSNGNPVPGATVTAASGYNYNGTSETPEPASMWLLMAGCALLSLGCAGKRAAS